MNTHVHIFGIYRYIHVYMYKVMFVHVYAYMCVYIRAYIYIYLYTYICMYIDLVGIMVGCVRGYNLMVDTSP